VLYNCRLSDGAKYLYKAMKIHFFLILCLSICLTLGCAQEDGSEADNRVERTDPSATSSSPAIVRIRKPMEKFDISQSSLEVKVRAARTSEDEAFIVVVYEQKEGGTEQLDSFTFFPGAREGDVQNFLIQVPAELAERDAVLQFRLVSADPNQTLAVTEIQILDTKLLISSNP